MEALRSRVLLVERRKRRPRLWLLSQILPTSPLSSSIRLLQQVSLLLLLLIDYGGNDDGRRKERRGRRKRLRYDSQQYPRRTTTASHMLRMMIMIVMMMACSSPSFSSSLSVLMTFHRLPVVSAWIRIPVQLPPPPPPPSSLSLLSLHHHHHQQQQYHQYHCDRRRRIPIHHQTIQPKHPLDKTYGSFMGGEGSSRRHLSIGYIPPRCSTGSSALYVSSNDNHNNGNGSHDNSNAAPIDTKRPIDVHPSKRSTPSSKTTGSSSTKEAMNSSSSSSSSPNVAKKNSSVSKTNSTIMMNPSNNSSRSSTKKSNSSSNRVNHRNNNTTNSTNKTRNKTNKQSTRGNVTNTKTITSKQELVKAVGESIQATRQKQQQQQQRIKQIARDTAFDDITTSTRSTDKMNQIPDTKSSSLSSSSSTSIFNQLLNPYEAGQKLRQSIETTITALQTQTDPQKSVLLQQSQYYIDDRFMERGTVPITSSSTSLYSTSSSSSSSQSYNSKKRAALLPWEEPETAFIPEILVVGATGRLGRLIVRQLLQQKSSNTKSNARVGLTSQSPPQQQQVPKVRVRVLVRDLYTRTLDILGTGVTYCQGDLSKIDTLEDAVTDIDKLVFVASASSAITTNTEGTVDEQEQYQRRIQMAEQIDYIGMSNLISAYQNVRHADYGTSQAAKRSLFKFQDRNREDFYLFSIDEDDDDDNNNDYADDDVRNGTTATSSDNGYHTDTNDEDNEKSVTNSKPTSSGKSETLRKLAIPTTSYDDGEYDSYDETYENMMDSYSDTYGYDEGTYDDLYDEYNKSDEEANYEAYATRLNNIEKRNDASVVKTQSQWIRNTFDHGVFVGRIPQTSSVSGGNVIGGEAAIISSRLRARDDPEMGIELGPNFAGFICRICSDGNMYEAFVRTGSYVTNGIEYVCEFTTATKNPTSSSTRTPNSSRNKFLSVRLPFSSFKPVQRKTISRSDSDDDSYIVPPFRGYDVRHIGFRYRSSSNSNSKNGSDTIDRKTGVAWHRFYLSISYIKLYRSQPEPEFVYVSDARIPHNVYNHMIEHESKQILPYSDAPFQSLSNRDNGPERNLLQRGTEIQLELQSNATSTVKGTNRLSTNTDHAFVHSKRLPEETYYKYRGEELLKKSGLSYAIVRVGELCDSPASLDGMNNIILSSSISSSPTNDSSGTETLSMTKINELVAISRADIAQICVQALLDPNALNKSFYVHRTEKAASTLEDLTSKFASLPTDTVP